MSPITTRTVLACVVKALCWQSEHRHSVMISSASFDHVVLVLLTDGVSRALCYPSVEFRFESPAAAVSVLPCSLDLWTSRPADCRRSVCVERFAGARKMDC